MQIVSGICHTLFIYCLTLWQEAEFLVIFIISLQFKLFKGLTNVDKTFLNEASLNHLYVKYVMKQITWNIFLLLSIQ